MKPDRASVFGASTGTIGGGGVRRLKERGLGDLHAFGKLIGDGFDVGFYEAHGADKDRAVGVHEKNCGNHGEAIGVGDDVAFFFGIEKNRESDAVFLDETCSFLSAVLADAEDREVGRFVSLMEALEEGKRELANGAADFEKGEKNWAFFERSGERELFAVKRLKRKIWGDIAGDDVGHTGFGSEPM